MLSIAVAAVTAASVAAVLLSEGGGERSGVPFQAERPELTSADSSCYEERPAEAQSPPVRSSAGSGSGSALSFTDATREAGLCYLHHEPRLPPDCLFSSREDLAEADEIAVGFAFEGCAEERMAGGAAAGDYDRDGDPDLFVTRLRDHDLLFRNNGDGTFTDVSEESGLASFVTNSNGAGFADLDNDGDRDLVVLTIAEDRFYAFVNDGDGHFTEEASERGLALADDLPRRGWSVAFGDYDRDGWVDVHTTEWSYAAIWGREPPAHARLLRNLGAQGRPGHFEDVTEAAGVVLGEPGVVEPVPRVARAADPAAYKTASFASAFVDLDADGWQDLAVASDFGTSQLFWNNADGTFTEGTQQAEVDKEGNAMGSAFGDYDNDADLDWYVTAISTSDPFSADARAEFTGNRLYQNLGARSFDEVTADAGVIEGFWGWGAAFVDLDNDALLDIVETNGMFVSNFGTIAREEDTGRPMRLWRNSGDGTFEEVSTAAGMLSTADGKGLLTFDYDLDGDQDVFVVNNGQYPVLYRNDTVSGNHWLRIDVRGSASGSEALGAVVSMTSAGGQAGWRRQVRQVGVGAHYLAQNEHVLHYGLGPGSGPVSVEARFPATGESVVLEAVEPDQLIVIEEPE